MGDNTYGLAYERVNFDGQFESWMPPINKERETWLDWRIRAKTWVSWHADLDDLEIMLGEKCRPKDAVAAADWDAVNEAVYHAILAAIPYHVFSDDSFVALYLLDTKFDGARLWRGLDRRYEGTTPSCQADTRMSRFREKFKDGKWSKDLYPADAETDCCARRRAAVAHQQQNINVPRCCVCVGLHLQGASNSIEQKGKPLRQQRSEEDAAEAHEKPLRRQRSEEDAVEAHEIKDAAKAHESAQAPTPTTSPHPPPSSPQPQPPPPNFMNEGTRPTTSPHPPPSSPQPQPPSTPPQPPPPPNFMNEGTRTAPVVIGQERYTSRLVACDFSQVERENYLESSKTCAPVARMSTSQTMFRLTAEHVLELVDMTVDAACFNAPVEKDLHGYLPNDIASRNCCSSLSESITTVLGSWLTRLPVDPCPYVSRDEGGESESLAAVHVEGPAFFASTRWPPPRGPSKSGLG